MARVRLDHGGMREMLQSAPVADEVRDRADGVASSVRAQGRTVDDQDVAGRAVTVPLPVEVHSYRTDRAAAAVTLNHPAGLGMQAKHGVLTRAAGAAGLDVNRRRSGSA